MTSAYRPKYPHDCPKCVLLGAHIHEGVWHDLYYCKTEAVISRYGPNDQFVGWDIDNTGRRSLVHPTVNTAIDMATKRGLIHEPATHHC